MEGNPENLDIADLYFRLRCGNGGSMNPRDHKDPSLSEGDSGIKRRDLGMSTRDRKELQKKNTERKVK